MTPIARLILGAALALLPIDAQRAQAFETSAGDLAISRMADGFDEPWGLAFLPDGGFLVTELDGRLTLVAPGGGTTRVGGLPDVARDGQGGLLDVMVPRDFAQSREVFLSFATRQRGGQGTALGVGQLSADGDTLQDFRVIYEMPAGTSGGRHFGSRIVEARDGTLFLTIGDRGEGANAQDGRSAAGKVLRLNRDGSVPADNPFLAEAGILPEIWTTGHRNPQGAALDLAGALWVHEHGAQGGDEVNRVVAGANYGWPLISYGEDYGGGQIGSGTAAPGLEQPQHYWDPSIAPSGLMIYSGRLWPEWRGDLFVGSLKFDQIQRLDPDRDFAAEVWQTPETGRVRDIREAPDGTIWFVSVNEGAVFRIAPR